MARSSRQEYGFGRTLRYERNEGCGGVCEHLGCNNRGKLQAHHLIPCYLASRNPILIPTVIKQISNVMMLCPTHHKQYDEHQKTWNEWDVGYMAFALFGLDPEEVSNSQRGTYLDKQPPIGGRKKKKRRKHKYRRRRSKKKRRY